MPKRMLIDAMHPEEMRVVVLDNERLLDFEHETSTKKQIKGNIYLAKVMRVEPSLQAAFVDYGGNRHGFLPFNEIHPDYYRIPIADRQRLLAEEAAQAEAEAEAAANGDGYEVLGGDDTEDLQRRRQSTLRHYKIQEVVVRRQIMLVQVTKEERGTKGAALTTYLSLAGRYCVLMPNTSRGGGVSRKIGSVADRKRLRGILDELEVPEGMAVIVRTAGSERSKAEIKRDYDYLLRLWSDIRQLTLESTAPALIHEEANLVKRAIRDLYTRDIEEVIIEGEDGYKTAKTFMKMLIPSHAKRVKRYQDPVVPLFHRYRVEAQIDDIHSPTVKLKSGGYLVINPTEALVSIDVNSGRATRERHIEETALRTNMEASEEISRQLRLRDLAGLIVIDFIDMEETRNNAQVERRLKEGLRHDRARIQLSRISPFGLLEMSRQRLRPSVIEASSQPCPHCSGTGHLRSTESSALRALRALEEEGIRGRAAELRVTLPIAVGLYILNNKRLQLAEIERRYDCRVIIASDDTRVPPDYRIERLLERTKPHRPEVAPVEVEAEEEEEEIEETEAAEPAESETAEATEAEGEGAGRRRRRRRRRRGRPEGAVAGEGVAADAEGAPAELSATADDDAAPAGDAAESEETRETAGASGEERGRRRRRSRRGGRRRRRGDEREAAGPAGADLEVDTAEIAEHAAGAQSTDSDEAAHEVAPADDVAPAAEPQWHEPGAPAEEAAEPQHDWSDLPPETSPVAEVVTASEPPSAPEVPEASEVEPALDHLEEAAPEPSREPAVAVVTTSDGAEEEQNQTKRRGWWQRLMQP
jgi:ribonuclease E